MAPRSPHTATGEANVSPVHDSALKDHNEAGCATDEVGTLTLKRKAAMCVGMMASEAMGVFSNLNEMPLQQTLGCPVSLLTLPGAVSASAALIFVPLQGWLSDGGSNPRQRKKPITVAAFCVGFLGLCLNLSATILHTWGKAVTSYGANHSVRIDDPDDTVTGLHLTDLQANQTTLSGFETMSSLRMGSTNESEFTKLTTEAEINVSTTASTVLGLPLPVVFSMAGFIFMDMSFDLTTSAVKTLMLTHSVPADHVSLLVTGVFMSALGGCITPLFSLVDLSSLFPDVDPVSTQAMVQLAILLGLCVFSCTCTIVSTPRVFSPADITDDQSDENNHQQDKDLQAVEGGTVVEGGLEDTGLTSMSLHTDVQENIILATRTPAEAFMSNSTQMERSVMGLSISTTLSRSHHHSYSMDDKTPLLRDNNQWQLMLENSNSVKAAARESCLENRKVKLCVVWLAAFFSGCCIFTFNVTIADFIGKVVYGGNPDADARSETYLLYQDGIRTASLCILILNVAYVTLALSHSKVLANLSPKTEYIVFSLVVMVLIVATRLTANLWVIYITAAVVGLNRAAMYTVPFVLATQLCQQVEAEKQSTGKGSKPRFGSLMALVTSSLPSAYLIINIIIGPLVDATGDPSAPLLIGIVCSLLAAATMLCYKS